MLVVVSNVASKLLASHACLQGSALFRQVNLNDADFETQIELLGPNHSSSRWEPLEANRTMLDELQ